MRVRSKVFGALVGAVFALAAAGAHAALWREVTAPVAVLYDGPSDKASKLFVVPAGVPLEVLSSLPAWVKVRDVEGSILWVGSAELGPARHVIAIDTATIRKSPSDAAEVSFRVARGVLLERLGPRTGAGWYEVRNEGTTGFVRASEVWGD